MADTSTSKATAKLRRVVFIYGPKDNNIVFMNEASIKDLKAMVADVPEASSKFFRVWSPVLNDDNSIKEWLELDVNWQDAKTIFYATTQTKVQI